MLTRLRPSPSPSLPSWPRKLDPPSRSGGQAPRSSKIGAAGKIGTAGTVCAARQASTDNVATKKWEDIMAKLPRPQAPAIFRSMFPDLVDWLESPWTGPPPFLVAQAFRVEEAVQDNRYVIRAELPGLDPDEDIEVTVDGRTLTIHAERRKADNGPYRSEFRYGSLTRSVRLPAKIGASSVTARYEKGVLKVSVPVREIKPEGTQVPIETADFIPADTPARQEPVPGEVDEPPDRIRGDNPDVTPVPGDVLASQHLRRERDGGRGAQEHAETDPCLYGEDGKTRSETRALPLQDSPDDDRAPRGRGIARARRHDPARGRGPSAGPGGPGGPG